jgi:hypothetical protein
MTSRSEREYDLPSDDGCIECGNPRMHRSLYCLDHVDGLAAPVTAKPGAYVKADAYASAEITAHAVATNPRRWCRCNDPECEGECVR